MMVSALAGFFGGLDTHRRAPKTCPLAFDEERDETVLVAAQAFDPTCRQRLREKLPEELPAFEALLELFSATSSDARAARPPGRRSSAPAD
jgi:hypothetical protein